MGSRIVTNDKIFTPLLVFLRRKIYIKTLKEGKIIHQNNNTTI